MLAKDNIFREYDIRGVVGKEFDAAFAERLGFEYGRLVCENFAPGGEALPAGGLRVAVGCDCRLSSPELSQALMKGIRDGGVGVIDTGMGPTPQVYFMVFSQKLAGGIQVTGSHNPGDQNGFKIMVGTHTLSGPDIQDLKRRVQGTKAAVAEQGSLEKIDARELYTKELIARSKSEMGKRKVKVVVDGGNGVGGLVGPRLLRELGCEVIEIFTDPDGRFPNHHPDPTVVENLRDLQKRVIAENADAGIAWDGDADRIGVVDEQGNPIFGDMLLLIYGRHLLKTVQKPKIIGDVKCSELLFTDLEKRGAQAIMSKTGHSLIKAKLKEVHADLAGEMSGHIFFANRYFGFDDAIHSSARFVEIVSQTDAPVSSFLADLPKVVTTPEIRVDCPEKVKFQVAEKAKLAFPEFKTNPLDGVRVAFEHGWGLVRASNTQPVLVMRFEADSAAHLEEYQTLVETRIKAITAELLK